MKSFVLFALAALLAACSTTPEHGTANLGEAEHWSVSGKVGIWANGERESANFHWQNCGTHYRIRLSGPLGVGSVLINGSPRQVSLQRGGEPTRYAATPEALLADMGWVMPVSALHYWLRGEADPRTPSRSLTSSNQHPALEQHGWLVEYTAGNSLPEKISMTHHSARLKWLLRDWQTHRECPLP